MLRHTLLITEIYVCAVELGRTHPVQLDRFETEPSVGGYCRTVPICDPTPRWDLSVTGTETIT